MPGGDSIDRSCSSPAIGAGAGVQGTQITSRNLTSPAYPGVICHDQFSRQEPLLPLLMNLEGQAISARFRLRTGLSWQVIPRGFPGACVQFSQSTLVNTGGLGFDENANNIRRDGGEIRVPFLRSLSIGGRFRCTFRPKRPDTGIFQRRSADRA